MHAVCRFTSEGAREGGTGVCCVHELHAKQGGALGQCRRKRRRYFLGRKGEREERDRYRDRDRDSVRQRDSERLRENQIYIYIYIYIYIERERERESERERPKSRWVFMRNL
jgi:hypothetical protein